MIKTTNMIREKYQPQYLIVTMKMVASITKQLKLNKFDGNIYKQVISKSKTLRLVDFLS